MEEIVQILNTEQHKQKVRGQHTTLDPLDNYLGMTERVAGGGGMARMLPTFKLGKKKEVQQQKAGRFTNNQLQ